MLACRFLLWLSPLLRQPPFESQPKRAHFLRCLAFGFNLGHALARPCRGQKYASRVDAGTENLTRRLKRGDVFSQMRVFQSARVLIEKKNKFLTYHF